MSKKSKIILISAVVAASVLIGLGVSALYSVNTFASTDKIISNAKFYGVVIGGKTTEEAIKIIKESEELPGSAPINVEYDGKSFIYSPNGAGIEYDIEGIVKSAFEIGRKDSFFGNLKDLIRSNKEREIKPLYKEDKEIFETTIETLAQESDIKFETFTANIYETYADIKINENKTIIDYDKLLETTYEIIDDKENRAITLPIKQSQGITAEEVYDKIYVEPRNAKAVVKDGVMTVVSHQVGVLLDIKEIEEGLNSGKDSFRIKINKKYPEIRSEHLSGDLFNEVLGTFKSTYNAGLIGRTKNVSLAAARINGYILNPNEVFSYNGVVGPRTYAAGFRDATIYTNAGLEEGLGGGICQVSSTLYNAALYADLKIVERRNHTYTVNYVRNGLDATVAYGAIDFRFSNNKSSPIKIVANASGGVLTISILGKKENNNTVELYTNTLESYSYPTEEVMVDTLNPGERKVKQNGAMGYKINATKVVKDESGQVIRNEFLGTSTYKPIPHIIEVGLGEAPVSGEPAEDENNEELNTELEHPESGQVTEKPEENNENNEETVITPDTDAEEKTEEEAEDIKEETDKLNENKETVDEESEPTEL